MIPARARCGSISTTPRWSPAPPGSSPDRHGMSEWHLEGHAQNVDGHTPLDPDDELPRRVPPRYRRLGMAVGHRHDRLAANGAGAVACALRRRRQAVVFDLLFTAPDVTRIPRIDVRADRRAAHPAGRAMQLPSIGSQPVVLSLDGRANHPSFA